jgi:hypothetical protein
MAPAKKTRHWLMKVPPFVPREHRSDLATHLWRSVRRAIVNHDNLDWIPWVNNRSGRAQHPHKSCGSVQGWNNQ